jgi:prepilin-type N-terminal cleavage/methylation domain-containing protein
MTTELVKQLRKNSDKKGFTLVEMLVAVTILMIGVGGPLLIGINGISLAIESKPRVTAIYLAEEALEIIRNTRDTSILNGDDFDVEFRLPNKCYYDTPGSNYGCMVDVWGEDISDRIINCTGLACEKLRYIDIGDERRYGHDSGWTESMFTRIVGYIETDDPGYEARVRVVVSWTEKGTTKSVVAENYLYSWEE